MNMSDNNAENTRGATSPDGTEGPDVTGGRRPGRDRGAAFRRIREAGMESPGATHTSISECKRCEQQRE